MTDFDAKLEKMTKQLLFEAPQKLIDSVLYTLLLPGKRIRPRLAATCGALVGLDVKATDCIAMSVEMLHCFTLIHDDLPCMDDDQLRRGKPANHLVFGEAIALLAGDALNQLAVECLFEAEGSVNPKHLLHTCRFLMNQVGPNGVIGGQVAEMDLGSQTPEKNIGWVHEKKTAALFVAAAVMPLIAKGLSPLDPKTQALNRFALHLGLGFQILDDLDDLGSQPDPANVFYENEKDTVLNKALRSLYETREEVVALFSKRSENLILIQNEVVTRLKGAL